MDLTTIALTLITIILIVSIFISIGKQSLKWGYEKPYYDY